VACAKRSRGCARTASELWCNGPTRSREGQITRKRYKGQGTGSFVGEHPYDGTAPDGRSLRQLEGLVDWEVYAEKLVRLYRVLAEVGRLQYHPSMILKMLQLS